MLNRKKAVLVLKDGTVFEGFSFGTEGETWGEVVFNTSMTGYQEILTDPSYRRQIVTMTYTEIGNYGVNDEDVESDRVQVAGFVVREYSEFYSNWRARRSLEDYLKDNGIVGICGVDTRKLTRHIRIIGAMMGIIKTEPFNIEELKEKAKKLPDMAGMELVSEVTTKEVFKWGNFKPNQPHIVAIDFGTKWNILRLLESHGFNITVVPATTSAEEIMLLKPDGVFLSNGPGDPFAVKFGIETVKNLIGEIPIFGICLGHQILSLALGGRTYKLKFGHRGGNQPVRFEKTGKVEITAQNHGFAVDEHTIPDDVEITHINLNDGTVEGIKHKKLPVFSVQYHPEASPGPHDARYLFELFYRTVESGKIEWW